MTSEAVPVRDCPSGDLADMISASAAAGDLPSAIASASAAAENRDMFGRLRISHPQTIFDSKQLKDNQPLFWDDSQTSGSDTSSTYNTNQASTSIAVGNLTAGTRVRQTFRRFNYQPGKSQLILMTGVIGASATGITSRLGQMDDSNGLFFEQAPSGIRVARRTSTSGSPVDTAVAQADWNGDKLDGTGASGVTADWSKTQIFWICYEWLGVGSVAFGIVHQGEFVTCHTMHHNNSLSVVYMSSPNLPLRYEISNSGTGAAASMTHICSSVSSEGGIEELGVQRGLNRGTTAMTTSNDANIYGLIAIRIRSSYFGAHIHINSISTVCTSSSAYNWMLIVNPTPSSTVTYTAVTNSSIEANTAMTGITLTGGTVIMSGTSLQTNDGGVNIPAPQDISLGASIAGTADTLFLAVQRITGTSETFYASMNYREII